MRSKRLRRFYVEIDILIVTRHLRLDNVVAPSRIHIRPGGEITRTVAVIRIARMIVISLFDLPPLVETAVQVDRYRFAGRFGLGNPFVLPDIGDQLVVIVVGMAALHRFDVSAELLVVLVDEIAFAHFDFAAAFAAFGSGEKVPFLHLLGVIRIRPVHLSGRPFVPAGHEYKFRIDLQRTLPLLIEIKPLIGIGRRIVPVVFRLHAVAETPSDIRQRMLRGCHRHVLGPVGRLVPADRLRIMVHPWPLVMSVVVPPERRPRPALSDREKIPDLFRETDIVHLLAPADDMLPEHQQRLAFPAEPQIGIQPPAVDLIPELLHRILAGQAGDLRRGLALGTHLAEHFGDEDENIFVNIVVRIVENDQIDTRVGEHPRMTADDPLVLHDVVTRFRLSPVMDAAAPFRVHRIGLQYLGHVIRTVFRPVLVVGYEIEHRHRAVRFTRTALRITGQRPS